ncbi:MAG: hypothetical protein RL338_586 [Chloroflexota bacterium]
MPPMSAAERSTTSDLTVAVLGLGVVGGEVAAALLRDEAAAPRRFAPADGRPLRLAAVHTRTAAALARHGIPAAYARATAKELVGARAGSAATPSAAPATAASAATSPTPPTPPATPAHLGALVETIGGIEPAHAYLVDALERGIPVATANKAVVAAFGPELEALSRRTGAALRFEAAVGGGTPVLTPIAESLAANRLTRVRGIVNGTTNFILTAMTRDGAGYEETLRSAQERGYAEADPSGDVEGRDPANKLVLLVRLAFGRWIRPDAIPLAPPTLDPDAAPRPGITGVTGATIAGAAALGCRVKLIADATLAADGTLATAVLPTIVPLDDPFATTDGVLNRVEVWGDPIGTVAFVGPGAGGPATSTAVLADLLAIARGAGSTWGGLPPATDATEASTASTAATGPSTAPAPATTPAYAPDAPRDWFAVAPIGATRIPALPGTRVAELDGAVAIRFADRTLADVRAVLRDAGAPGTTQILPAERAS